MKRIFRFLFFLLVLLFAAALILPVVFKDSIVERIKQEANANLNARMDFEDVDLALISTFPYFGFSLEGLEIIGVDNFEGQKLLSAGDFQLSIDLMSVLSGESYSIEKIAVEDLDLRILILEDGSANFDIVKGSEEAEEAPEATESSAFHLALQSWEVHNFDLQYQDREADMEFHLEDLNQEGSGDFTENIVAINTHTEAKAISFLMEGMAYLNRVQLESDFGMELNQEKFKFTFGENTVKLNDLAMQFSGWLAMPNEAIDMDLKFSSPDNSFKSLISLIPALYYQDFQDLKTSGEFKVDGIVQGKMIDNIYPSFDVNLNVRNGFFQYPDLPAAVEKVNIDFKAKNTSRNLEGTEINLSRMEAVVAGSTISGSFQLKEPLGDPKFAFQSKAKAELSDLAKAIPMEGYEMSGGIDLNMFASGSMSMIDQEQYEQLKAGGALLANKLHFGGDSLGMRLDIPQMDLKLQPSQAVLGPSTLIYEGNEMNMKGVLDNLIAYALRDELLSGSFDFSSPRLDLLALAGEESSEAATTEEDTTALSVLRLPQNIDFVLNAKIDSLLYDNIRIANLNGNIRLKEGKASMEDVDMNMLDGKLSMSGSYDSKPEVPSADFRFAINGFSFKESYRSLDMVKQIAPIMENMEGNYDMALDLNTLMSNEMSPDLNTVNASGLLRTKSVQTGGEVFNRLATFLNNPDYQKLKVENVNLNFAIVDGKLEVEPFDFKLAGQKADLGGSMSLSQDLDFDLNTSVPLKSLKAENYLQQFSALSSGSVPLTVKIGGKATKPTVRPSLGNLKEELGKELKEKLNKAVDSAKTVVKQEVNKKLDELVKEAEAQGDKLIEEARKRGEQLKAEAKVQADKIRAGGETAAKKILDEAGSNPLKQAAARPLAEKARKEANAKAQQVEEEAAKQANQLIEAAENQKQKLIDDAKAKAQI